jgi:trigger factor
LGVKADLALRAVVAQEQIEVSDPEVDEEIARLAERADEKPEKVRKELEQRGVIEAIRSDIARGKALQLLVDQATVVDESGNPVDLSIPDGSTAEGTEPDVPESGEEEEETKRSAGRTTGSAKRSRPDKEESSE